MDNPKILIVNPFGIGDVIFSTPMVDILKDRYPASTVGYLCNRRSYEVIRSNPSINKIFVYEKDEYRILWQRSKIECIKMVLRLLKSIRKERFNIMIDLSLGYQYGLWMKIIGIRRRLGFNYRNRGRFLTKKIAIGGFNDKHVIEYYLDTLRLLDIDPSKYSASPKVYIADNVAVWAEDFLKDSGIKDGELLIGVIPGCGASWGKDAVCRRWDKAGFAKVCDALISHHHAKIILLGDPKEVEICEDTQKLMSNKAIMACGKTSLSGFMAILKKCKLVITNDGGPLHMAVGVGTRTISIFGPVDEKVYGPYPIDASHIVISRDDVPCRPCYKRFKYTLCKDRLCLNGIRHEEILAAAEKLLVGGENS